MPPSPIPPVAGRRRSAKPGRGRHRRRRRLLGMVVIAVVTAVAASAGSLTAARSALGTVRRTDAVAGALSPSSDLIENFLLVGSDSRANSDPTSPDAGGIGTVGDVQGSRSDTIMILRRDRSTGAASLLSIPRDLWVTIAGTGKKNRINSAFDRGADVLVNTVEAELDVPIHHYIEIDFSGFKQLVDAIGGVRICFAYPTRDANTGLNVVEPGCFVFGGVQALAYARSRHYQELRDGAWHEDGTADIGRTKRQRDFIDRALRAALDRIKSNPFRSGDVVRGAGSALTVDGGLDLVGAAASLRSAASGDLQTFALPVRGNTIKGKSVLLLGEGSDQVLSFFRGDGPAPVSGS